MSECRDCLYRDAGMNFYLCRDCTGNNFVSRDAPPMRTFNTGATRSGDAGKLDFEGFLSPEVLIRYAEYMHKHRLQEDGELRASDNWQKGIPKDQYMKSMFRHFMDVWTDHRNGITNKSREEAVTALMFNVMGYLHTLLNENRFPDDTIPGTNH